MVAIGKGQRIMTVLISLVNGEIFHCICGNFHLLLALAEFQSILYASSCCFNYSLVHRMCIDIVH